MKKPAKAVSYLRVSSRGQVKKDGFPRQRRAVQEYTKAHRLELIDEFRDEGVSGAKETFERPGLTALLDRILANGVKVVLVEKADRLARDLIVGELILGEFRKAEVKVIAAESGTDLTAGDDNPTAKLIRQVLGAVAEFEKTGLVLKLRAARERRRRKEGRCEGRKPFGTLPGEQETLARMKVLYRNPRRRKRLSCGKIAAILNEEGRPTRTGRPWNPGTVWALMRR